MYIYYIYATQGSFGIDDEIWSENEYNNYKECTDAALDDADDFFFYVNDKYKGGRGNEPYEVKIEIYTDRYATEDDGDEKWTRCDTTTLYPYIDASGYDIA